MAGEVVAVEAGAAAEEVLVDLAVVAVAAAEPAVVGKKILKRGLIAPFYFKSLFRLVVWI